MASAASTSSERSFIQSVIHSSPSSSPYVLSSQRAMQKLNSLIKERNLVKKERREGEEEEEEIEVGGRRDTEHVEQRKRDPNVMSEIEKFRQAQAERDRKKEEERVKLMKRKIEQRDRQERLNVSM